MTGRMMAAVAGALRAMFMALVLAMPVHAASPAAEMQRPAPKHPPATHNRQSFNDLVRQLVASGEVEPLREVLEAVRKSAAGDVVAIKLHHQKPHWVYHVRVLKADGRRVDLDIDGKTLKIIEGK